MIARILTFILSIFHVSLVLATQSIVILPDVDLYVDPANPTVNYDKQALQISSDASRSAEKLAFVRYDLSALPPGSTVNAAQIQQIISDAPTNSPAQQVVINYVSDNSWDNTITYDTKPAADSTKRLGQWFYQGGTGEYRAQTPADNPLLVAQLQSSFEAAGSAISLQLSTTSGGAGAGTEQSYASYASANAAQLYAQAPRLIIEYTPPATHIPLNWNQWQGDASHTGRTPWNYAQFASYTGATQSTLASAAISPISPIINEGTIYLLAGTSLYVVDPANPTPVATDTLPTTYRSAAIGPKDSYYALSSASIDLFSFSNPSSRQSTVALSNATQNLSTGATNGAFLIQNNNSINAFVIRSGAITYSWQYTLPSTPTIISSVSLSPNGSRAYVATNTQFYALNAANGELIWKYDLPASVSTIQSPVVANDGNNTVYFAADDKLYVFQDAGAPLQGSPVSSTHGNYAQPVLNSNNQLILLAGSYLSSYTTNNSQVAQVTAPTQVSGLTANTAIQPTIDGSGNIYLIDGAQKLFAIGSNFTTQVNVAMSGITTTQPLQLDPNGTVYTCGSSGLIALAPTTPDTVAITTWQNNTTYRANQTLTLPSNAIPADYNIILHSKGTIQYPDSISIPIGTTLFNQTGY